MKKLLLVAVSSLAVCAAQAADLPTVKKAAALPAAAPCTVQQCSGFYLGVNLSGQGSNADILGQGINGSIFAGGGMLGAQAGYQWWNGQWMFAIEGGADGVVTSGTQVGAPGTTALATVDNRLFAWQVVKAGLGLQGLFGAPTATATPGQTPAPIQIPQFLLASLAAPYVQFGAAERIHATGWLSGAGAIFVLAQNWTLNVDYKHVSYSGTPADPANGVVTALPKTDDIVTVGLNWNF
jgi:opacity protein-like surface antigen